MSLAKNPHFWRNIGKLGLGVGGALYNVYKSQPKKTTKMARKRKTTTKKTTVRTRKRKAATYQKTVSNKRRRMKRKFKNRNLNVKADVTRYTKTYYKQKCTSQQQKKINRKFKDENNPYTYLDESSFIDTVPQTTDSVKYYWHCNNGRNYVDNAWKNFIRPESGQATDNNEYAVANFYYKLNQDQSIYFHTFKTKYEICNPTNYDMHVVIYDLVCKRDTYGSVTTSAYSTMDELVATPAVTSTTQVQTSNPVALMYQGLNSVINGINNQQYLLQDSSDLGLFDIQMTPTKSYPFNIHWTVIKKHTITLQPGATMFHTFIHKPKALVNRGYWAYKYCRYGQQIGNCGLEDITSGTLFKVWGQLAGDTGTSKTPLEGVGDYITQDNAQAAVNLSGRIIIKSFFTAKHYCMQPKASYVHKQTNPLKWKPDDEEDLLVINDTSIKNVNDDIDTNDPDD